METVAKVFCIIFFAFCGIALLFGLYQQIQRWRGKPYRKCLFPICEEADGYIYPERKENKRYDKEDNCMR